MIGKALGARPNNYSSNVEIAGISSDLLHTNCWAVNDPCLQIMRIDWEGMINDVKMRMTSLTMTAYYAICAKILRTTAFHRPEPRSLPLSYLL